MDEERTKERSGDTAYGAPVGEARPTVQVINRLEDQRPTIQVINRIEASEPVKKQKKKEHWLSWVPAIIITLMWYQFCTSMLP